MNISNWYFFLFQISPTICQRQNISRTFSKSRYFFPKVFPLNAKVEKYFMIHLPKNLIKIESNYPKNRFPKSEKEINDKIHCKKENKPDASMASYEQVLPQ